MKPKAKTPNKIYPGRPKYVGHALGIFLCLHHEELAEFSHDVTERVRFVKKNKPANEIKTRLWSMVYVSPRYLPDNIKSLLAEAKKANRKWQTARAKLDKNQFSDRLGDLEWEAVQERNMATDDLEKATSQWSRHDQWLLLDKLLPGNVWNGYQLIFPPFSKV